ncbi:ATP-binding cassette domain-containing protein [Acholeplasma sp. OttesenSCG-928-E16]|nr:ATP-binding cassette domain-containing protein [Acholeplasma sp. OttesenSCG-928-E16]
MKDIILKTNNLSKRYGNVYAVKGANMTIHKKDVYGFIGENGSGKTTLIRMITGLIKSDEGSYELFGVNANEQDIYSARSKVGAIVEVPSIHLNLSATDNLSVQLRLIGKSDDSIIGDTLQSVGLGYLIGNNKKAKSFSLGMKQRLGIAMALLSEPEFLILDEPMNGLDPEGIAGIRVLIQRLNKENGITFLISSHILSELAKVATRYGFIHRGELIKEINADDIQDKEIKTDFFVSSNAKADEVLFGQARYDLIGNNIIRFYEEIDVSEIVILLNKVDIKVTNVKKIEDDIESYYFKVMGGGHND